MAKASGMTDILVLGAAGVGVYFAWPWITGFLTGLTTSMNAAGLPADSNTDSNACGRACPNVPCRQFRLSRWHSAYANRHGS